MMEFKWVTTEYELSAKSANRKYHMEIDIKNHKNPGQPIVVTCAQVRELIKALKAIEQGTRNKEKPGIE